MKKSTFKRLHCAVLAVLTLFGIVGLFGCQPTGGIPQDTTTPPDDAPTDAPEATDAPADNTTEAPAVDEPTPDAVLSSQYLVVTDYIEANSGKDVSAEIQKLIDENPNRTIFFPDGEYLISTPITTSAHPLMSVSLLLSDFAIIKATGKFPHGSPMIRLGADDNKANDILTPGSNYSFIGGVLDGSSRADGICLEGGRETLVRDVSIKNVLVGIHIMYGVNSGSSDHDIEDVNITGTGTTASTGVICEGHDNTFTNMRIGKVFVGMKITGSANMMRNIHPLYFNSDFGSSYKNSVGFWDLCGSNWYDYCYSDQFATAFKLKGGIVSIFDNCQTFWYTANGGKQVFFESDGQFNSIVTNCRAGFKNSAQYKSIIDVDAGGGQGRIENLVFGKNINLQSETYKDYLTNPVILF